jgi:competence protein CoiA
MENKMKFALVNGDRVEATKEAKGLCPGCGSELTARCGEVKINHWAHKGNRKCDPWWENETDWHRSWKDKFPIEWQEKTCSGENGELHFADVETDSGWVLEFQHSYLNPEKRRARNAFYRKLVWVVDGTRRKTDRSQFEKAIEDSTVICEKPLVRRVYYPEECKLLKEWDNSSSLIFFDFQEANSTKQIMLWFLYPKISTSETFISPFPRSYFIKIFNENKFDELVKNTIIPNREILEKTIQAQLENSLYHRPNILSGFQKHMAHERRRPRRL